MNTTHTLTLEAVSTFSYKKENESFYSTTETIRPGIRVSITVPLVITKTTIFTLPDNSKYIDDIIAQFHEKKIMISKNQLGSGYWKVIEDKPNADI